MAPSARAAALFFWGVVVSTDIGLNLPPVVAPGKLAGGAVEAPTRLTLGAWPNASSAVPGAAGEKTLWTVPLFPMKAVKPADSACRT